MKNSKSLPVPTKTNNHVSRTSEEELNRLAKMWCKMLLEQLTVVHQKGGDKRNENNKRK